MIPAHSLRYDTPDPERDAADRLSRLHGALELKATLLALLLPPGSQRAVRAYEIETTDIRPAQVLQKHVANLPASARLPWFEVLLSRMALHPLPLRQELLHATRRVMGARGTARPIDRLHWLAMRRGLGEPPASTARGGGSADVSEWLDTDLHAIASFSAFLSRMIPDDETAGIDPRLAPAWYGAVMDPWRGGIELPGCTPPDGEGAVRALLSLQTLSLVQRPMLLRAWFTAAARQNGHRPLTPTAADALRLTAGLMDTPLPAELAAQYIEVAPTTPQASR